VPADRAGILRAGALELGIEPERMDRISRLRRVDPRPDEATVRERMTELARIGRKVDGSAS
jgi:hypothetical protein